MRVAPLAASLICVLFSTAFAGDPEKDPGEALLAAARECPLTFRDAIGATDRQGRRALRAEYVLDTQGMLLLRATVRVTESDASHFEAWVGSVHGGGWVPRRRKLTEAGELEAAARDWALIEKQPTLFRKALKGAIRTDEHPGPATVALSIAPEQRNGTASIVMRVEADDGLRALRFDPQSQTYALDEATQIPERVAPLKPTIPSLDVVADGTWFNTVEPVSLDAWRGKPVLVVITDPG